MAIKINDIPPEGLTLELDEKKLGLPGGDAGTADVKATLMIVPSAGGILRMTGSIRAELVLECSRCLKSFPFRIDEPAIEIELRPGSSLAGHAEHELNRSELDVEFYQGSELDPMEVVREQLLLSVPMVPVHSPDCRGLCTVCGTDLNERECGCPRGETREGGPFSALKDILKKKE